MMMLKERKRQIYYYPPGSDFSPRHFGKYLRQLIEEVRVSEAKRDILFLCIGSDRSTGDSLGPLIGYKLAGRQDGSYQVLGTLEHPVHAVNLGETMAEIRRCYSGCVVVAIDASVGLREQVGMITLGRGAIRPGLGVSKDLEQVGDIFITGVVGSGGCLEPWILQNIRLSTVMKLADAICQGISAYQAAENVGTCRAIFPDG